MLVDFVERPEPTHPPALAPWWSPGAATVLSTTRQLAWSTTGRGYFTMDTPGTQGVVGFAGGTSLALGDVTIGLEVPFAVVLVTSLDRSRGIREAPRLLVTAVARSRNTGMRYSADGTRLEAIGGAPGELEGVRAGP